LGKLLRVGWERLTWHFGKEALPHILFTELYVATGYYRNSEQEREIGTFRSKSSNLLPK